MNVIKYTSKSENKITVYSIVTVLPVRNFYLHKKRYKYIEF